ncbi:hypothetical protein N665_0276s0005 [Sinapis alba]|nr:hypothetical protein N665_0276s0005 [Sinapis alba]
MDKQKPTASDLETEEARRLAKSEVGLTNVRARSERERKLVFSQQSSFSGKQHSQKWYRTTPKKKEPRCPSLWKSSSGKNYQTTSLVDEQIPGLGELGAGCKRFRKKSSWGAWNLYGGVVPSFCQTNKIWGIHGDDIYAPVNYKNNHWLAIWISIPKRHIVVWDSIVGCIRQAQLDQVMAPFVNMVPYLLVECAPTIEERFKYSLEPFTYETVNAPQCESGDCGLFALKYIECHALGFPFPGSLNPKNNKDIREKMAVNIFEEIPDTHQTETTDVDVNQDILPDDFQTTYRRHSYNFQTTSKRIPGDFQTASRRLPDDFHQTICRRHTNDFQTTSTRRLPLDDFQTTSTRRLPPDDFYQTTYRRLPEKFKMTSTRQLPDDL